MLNSNALLIFQLAILEDSKKKDKKEHSVGLPEITHSTTNLRRGSIDEPPPHPLGKALSATSLPSPSQILYANVDSRINKQVCNITSLIVQTYSENRTTTATYSSVATKSRS